MSLLASVYSEAGENDKAEGLMVELLEVMQMVHGAEHPDTLLSENNLASLYSDLGNFERALPLLEHAAQGMERLRFRNRHASRIVRNAVVVYRRAMRFEESDRWQRKLLEHLETEEGGDSVEYASELAQFGRKLFARPDFPQAELVLRECLAVYSEIQPDDWTTYEIQLLLGGALYEQATSMLSTDRATADAKLAEAKSLLVNGYAELNERIATVPYESVNNISQTLDRLVGLFSVTEEAEEIGKWQDELDRWRHRVLKVYGDKTL